jgi:hypothetical protein
MIQILAIKPRTKPATAAAPPVKPLFTPDQIASEALQSTRLAICAKCQFNQSGICRQCCGGVPIKTLVYLTASRCQRHYWS